MTFLAPLWIGVAAIAALGVTMLHLITTQRPPVTLLPTARFVPGGEARAAARAARPTDLVLLLLRIAALMMLGLAFAHPIIRGRTLTTVHVVVLDRSRSAGPSAADSARAIWRVGDGLVVFDSSARLIRGAASDSLRANIPAALIAPRGSLSAAVVAARQAARDVAPHTDSVELVIVSPVTDDELDAATSMLVAAWPGRIRLIRPVAAPRLGAQITLVNAAANDDLAPAIAALNAAHAATRAKENGSGPASPIREVRVIRTSASVGDSALARTGATIVEWRRPDLGAAAHADGVFAGRTTLVAPLSRFALPKQGRVVARWSDGASAAVESPIGTGCVRTVGIGIPIAGDVTLQPAFQSIASEMLAPCGGAGVADAAPDTVAALLERRGAPAPADAFEDRTILSPLAPWLIAAALLLLLSEWWMRPTRRAASP